MRIYVNENNEIKKVNSSDIEGLTPLDILDEGNPFKDWTEAKICCYRAEVTDGKVTMMTPYVDSRMIEQIDMMGQQIEELQKEIDSLTYTVNQVSESVAIVIKKNDSEMPVGDYLNPIPYVKGMTVETGKFYTDGDNIWDAIKDGIPKDFSDKEYFYIIEV